MANIPWPSENRERNQPLQTVADGRLLRFRLAFDESPVASGSEGGAVPGLGVAAGPLDGQPIHAGGRAQAKQHARIARRQIAAPRAHEPRELLAFDLGDQSYAGEVAILLSLQLD